MKREFLMREILILEVEILENMGNCWNNLVDLSVVLRLGGMSFCRWGGVGRIVYFMVVRRNV